MRALAPGLVLTPIVGADPLNKFFDEPLMVLLAHPETDMLVVIPIAPRRIAKRIYFRGPAKFSYVAVEQQLDASPPRLALLPFQCRPEATLTDSELDKRYRRRGQAEAFPLATLRARWDLIEPLVTTDDACLLFDRELRDEILEKHAVLVVERSNVDPADRSRRTAQIKKTLQRLLNQYWAGGSFPGALIGFTGACGARGKSRRASQKKRGRPNAKAKAHPELAGLNIVADSDDARIIEWCYRTWVGPGTTTGEACRRMWDTFFSVIVQLDDGTTKSEWLDRHLRPTHAQFIYWGAKSNPEEAAWRKQLPPKQFDRNYRATMGDKTDDVYAIGQRGSLDTTGIDVQLVRVTDRLARLGGAYRILIVDVMFGYIPGFYLGLDPPSSTTVKLAIYNALDPDKAQFLEDLGLDQIPPDDFIPIWFQNLWGDNTDLRSDEVMQCARGINTYVHYVPKMRPDLNSPVESSHHVLHRLVDHKLHGTTRGRRSERGETSPLLLARHTEIEALRETVRGIHYHNTAILEDHRTLRMKLKGVKPTRLDMTRAHINGGHWARSPLSIELARRQLLPRRSGTFTKDGVRLHRDGASRKTEFISHVVWVSADPVVKGNCELARRGRAGDGELTGDFIVNPYQPRRIWYADPNSTSLIQLDIKVLRVRDPDLPFAMTIPDMVDRDVHEGADRIDHREARDRQRGALDNDQRASRAEADEAYQAHAEKSGGEPSREAMKSNVRANREAEKKSTIFGMPLSDTIVPDSVAPVPNQQAEIQPTVQTTETSPPADKAPRRRTLLDVATSENIRPLESADEA